MSVQRGEFLLRPCGGLFSLPGVVVSQIKPQTGHRALPGRAIQDLISFLCVHPTPMPTVARFCELLSASPKGQKQPQSGLERQNCKEAPVTHSKVWLRSFHPKPTVYPGWNTSLGKKEVLFHFHDKICNLFFSKSEGNVRDSSLETETQQVPARLH